jgi:hypothetical protein
LTLPGKRRGFSKTALRCKAFLAASQAFVETRSKDLEPDPFKKKIFHIQPPIY